MKKILVVLAALLIVAVPVFAEKGQINVGLEAGYPSAGITGSYGINDDINAYATVSFNFANGLELGLGGEYKVYTLKIQDEKFDILAGLQVDPRFDLKAKEFNMGVFATAAAYYDFTAKTDSAKLDFSAYFRTGVGANLLTNKPFGFLVALGLVYHI